MVKDPIISVIMPVFNTEKYINECIDSVLAQTYSDFEFIIIDDCSSDRTLEIIKGYSDNRIKLIQNTENLGLTKNLNRAIDIANGEFIARMDADDICMPTRFEKQLAAFKSNTQLGICGTWFENFGDLSGITRYAISHDEIAFGLLYQSQFCHPTVMFRKSVLDNNELRYNETFTTAQDYELWSRIILKTQAFNIPEVLLKYRFHSQSISSTKKEQQLENRNKIITSYFSRFKIILEEEDIELLISFCNAYFGFNEVELNRLMNISEQLVLNLSNNLMISDKKTRSIIADKWYHLAFNNSKITFKLLKKASFYNELDFTSKVKLKLKSKFQ